jgi:hypothetical protein
MEKYKLKPKWKRCRSQYWKALLFLSYESRVICCKCTFYCERFMHFSCRSVPCGSCIVRNVADLARAISPSIWLQAHHSTLDCPHDLFLFYCNAFVLTSTRVKRRQQPQREVRKILFFLSALVSWIRKKRIINLDISSNWMANCNKKKKHDKNTYGGEFLCFLRSHSAAYWWLIAIRCSATVFTQHEREREQFTAFFVLSSRSR